MAITFFCKLLHAGQVIDNNCTCTFTRISRTQLVGGKLEGEGSIRTMVLLPFDLRGREPREFTLRFEHAIAPYVGKIEDVPIILVPDDLIGPGPANFKIGKIVRQASML